MSRPSQTRSYDRNEGTRVQYPVKDRQGVSALFTALVLVAGCGADRPQSAGDVPTALAELDLRIDGHEADLVPVDWMGIRSDGMIALIQRQDGSIRFFDRSGEASGTFGRSGAGPGEFRRPLRGGWIGDTVWIDDTELDRVTLISPEFQLVRTISRRSPVLRPRPDDEQHIPEFRPGVPYAVYPGDTMLVATRAAPGDPLADRIDGAPLIRVSADGVVKRIVVKRPIDEGASFFVSYDGGGAGTTVPFYPRPVWTVSPTGDRVALLTVTLGDDEESSFRLRVVDDQGEEVFDRTYPAPTEPIPEHVKDSVVAARAQRSSNAALRRAMIAELKDRIPSTYPPAEDIVLGTDGSVWVELHSIEEGNQWLVLGPTGEPERRVVVPDNVEIKVVDGRQLWGLETDEFDVQSVVRYRIRDASTRARS